MSEMTLGVDGPAYERLATDVRRLIGIDLAQYKPAQVWRRVNAFAARYDLPDATALIARARTDRALRDELRDMLTINVSEFFRDAAIFESFGRRYLRPFLLRQALTRVWSAGCSTGFEPYSIVMLARESAPGAALRVLATDLDETALAQARAGRYRADQMKGVGAARRTRFFAATDGAWEVRRELRSPITFRRHDLLRDPYESGFDVIVCRNVVIYFTEQAKAHIYRSFARALRPGGLLFMGATEAILDPRALGLVPAGSSFYEKPAA